VNSHPDPLPAASPSPSAPLQGGCLCGAVRYAITAPFISAGYCHCTRCQRRTGTGSSANGRVPRAGFRLLQGADHLRAFEPPTGVPKLFCTACGSALFSGDPLSDEEVAVRLGGLDRDPRHPTTVAPVPRLRCALGAAGRRRSRAPRRSAYALIQW
jgi:hypothetical protein